MSDVAHAPDAGAGANAPAPVTPAVELADDMSNSEMEAHLVEKWRKQREPAAPTPAAPPAKPIQAQEADAAPPQEAPGEKTEAVEPAETPPIDPPRSWTAGEKERFASLPRETQEYIAERERDRERELRRSQNEAAEQRKSLEEKIAQAEKARQDYETSLPQLIQTLRTAQAGEFADIKTQDDVNKMAAEDWPRFARWQAHMMQVGTLEQEAKAAQERRTQQQKAEWKEFSEKEDRKFTESHPEFSDATKSAKMAEDVIKTWEAAGGNREDLMKSYHGETALSARSSALQEILLKAALYDQAKAGISKPPAKPIPPVQKPGTAKPASNEADDEIATLTRRVAQTGSLKDATALRLAKMRRAANQ